MSNARRFYIPFATVVLVALISLFGCGGDGEPITDGGGGGGGLTGGTAGGDGQYVISGTQTSFGFDWGVNGDATQSQLDQIKAGIEASGGGLWRATEGNLRFVDQNLYNQSAERNIVIVNSLGGSAGICHMQTSGTTRSYYIELVGVDFHQDVFLHEFCHGQFWKSSEEYDCAICVMGTHMVGNTVENYCYSGDCQTSTSSARDCWGNYITQKYSFNRTGNRPSASSAPNFTVYVH